MPTLTSASKKARLMNEFNALRKVPLNDLYRWAIAKGEETPYVKSYVVTYTNPYPTKGNAITGRMTIQNEITIRFDLDDDYPNSCPKASIVKGDIPFLTNVFTSGNFCFGNLYRSTLFLWEWFNIVGRILAGDPLYTNTDSPANHEARVFYDRWSRKFPVGQITFPRARGL